MIRHRAAAAMLAALGGWLLLSESLSPELREKAKACQTPEEMLSLAKAEGYKLSEEELDAVSGGEWSCSDLATTDTRVV